MIDRLLNFIFVITLTTIVIVVFVGAFGSRADAQFSGQSSFSPFAIFSGTDIKPKGSTWNLEMGSGKISTGTTSPYAALSIEGTSALGNSALAGYFIATTTTATSTFAGGLTVDTDTLVVDYSLSRVGIGTIDPTHKLHVAENRADFVAVFRQTNANGAGIDYTGSGSGTNNAMLRLNNAGGVNKFIVRNDGRVTMGIGAGGGDVGIGTTSPYARLSVVGQIVGEYFTATSTTATSTFAATTTAPVFVGAITDIDGDTRIETEESSDEDVIRLYTNNAERLTVTNAGLVGIGGGVIGEMLHVENKNASGIATPIALLLSDSTLDSAGSAQITNLNISTFLRGTANHTTNDSTAPRGIFSNFQITNTGTMNNAFGGDYKVFYNSAGTLTKGVAFRGQINNVGGGTITDGRAVDALITVVTPATFTKATGIAVEFQNTLGTITDGIGIDVHFNNILGTFTTSKGINIRNSNNSGTWTTQYGIFIEKLFGTTAYGVYQEGTDDNYFAGNIGIATTSPYAKLSVEGEGVFEFLTATSTTATSTFQGGFAISSSATSTIAWGISIAEDGGVVGIGTTTPALSAMLGVAGDIYTSGTVRTENICGVGGSETAERGTVSTDARFAMGNGGTKNMIMACPGTVTALGGECTNCLDGVREVEIILYKNNSQEASCDVGSINLANTGSSTPCGIDFVANDLITCGSGTELGAVSGASCTFYYRFN